MSQFPQGPRNGSPPNVAMPPQWKPALLIAGVIGGIVVLLIVLAWLRQVWTDLMWFDSLGYQDVYTKILTTKIWLFFASAAAFAVLAAGNMWAVYRYSTGPVVQLIPQVDYKALQRLTLLGVGFVLLIAAVIFGSAAASRWETVLSFSSAASFGVADPQFGKDVAFFVFGLPLYSFIQGWFLGAFIVILILSLLLHVVLVSLRGGQLVATRPLLVHASSLGVGILLAFFFNYWIGIFELSFSQRGAVFGATYADVTARVFAHRMLMAVMVGGAGLLLFNAFVLRQLRLIGAVVGLWFGAALLVGLLYPGLVQRFRVQPSELDKERPYIERNIAATRQAFGLDNIGENTYNISGKSLSQDIVDANPETFLNLRLWDHRPLKDVLNQIQVFRTYYSFNDVDVDRYVVNGRYRQVMLAVRELSPESLPAEAQAKWVNRHLKWTHGQGVAMAPVTEFTSDGRPVFLLKDVPPSGILKIEQPAVYYGETNQQYVIVNSREEEVDYPTEADLPVYVKYQGTGGVALSSFWRRLAYAWQLRDVNILISSELPKESRLMYRRTVQEEIRTITPFLRLDRDPYIVVADGGLFWIQDAYTVTARYPNSDPSPEGFNYIRNSVKVVVDAYNGTATYYVADPNDPLVLTYRSIFPSLFQPMDKMPPALRAHVRYPEGLFQVQANKYLTYHMKDATVFFNKEDQWSIPNELFFEAPQPMEPYYLIMKLPGQVKEEFALLLPFTPAKRPNLVAWVAARMDGEHYGKMEVFTFPKDRQVDGPEQVEARIDNDPVVRTEVALYKQGGAKVLRGNLLVIPVENTLVYVEPLYLQPASLPFPELTRVIMVDGTRVSMHKSVRETLAALLGSQQTVLGSAGSSPIVPSTQPGAPAAAPAANTSAPATVPQRLSEANSAIKGIQEQLNTLQAVFEDIRRQLQPQGGGR
ncbi:MAG: UPF0182 family protein [Dehalococcoidia bacterium]|nr:UPF0182 family protein [Dehalococcoidia bacterium]